MTTQDDVTQEKTRIFLYKLFKNLDTAIALHYHTNYLSNLVRLSTMSQRIVGLTHANLMKIKTIYNESYVLTWIEEDDDVSIDIFCSDDRNTEEVRSGLITQIGERARAFEAQLDAYFAANNVRTLEDIPGYRIPLEDTKTRPVTATRLRVTKITKVVNPKRKFEFTEKKAHTATKAAKGLSLLERIKLREKQQPPATPKSLAESRKRLLDSKLPHIYEVIYEQSPKFSRSKTVSISVQRLQQLARDSLDVPISGSDVGEAVLRIAERLSMKVVSVGDTQVLRVGFLDREGDLAKLSELSSLRSLNKASGSME